MKVTKAILIFFVIQNNVHNDGQKCRKEGNELW